MLHCVEPKNPNPDEEKSAVDLIFMMLILVMMRRRSMMMMMITSSNVRLCRASKLRMKRTTKRKRQRLEISDV